MNWFHLLKVQRQTQRQGVSARQKDEEFIFEDEDNTCYEKLESFIRSKSSHIATPSSTRTYYNNYKIIKDTEPAHNSHLFYRPDMPDEVYCEILNQFKSKESSLPSTVSEWENTKRLSHSDVSIAPDLDMLHFQSWASTESGVELLKITYMFKFKRRTVFSYSIYRPKAIELPYYDDGF